MSLYAMTALSLAVCATAGASPRSNDVVLVADPEPSVPRSLDANVWARPKSCVEAPYTGERVVHVEWRGRGKGTRRERARRKS